MSKTSQHEHQARKKTCRVVTAPTIVKHSSFILPADGGPVVAFTIHSGSLKRAIKDFRKIFVGLSQIRFVLGCRRNTLQVGVFPACIGLMRASTGPARLSVAIESAGRNFLYQTNRMDIHALGSA
jgi:hypothetical protein